MGRLSFTRVLPPAADRARADRGAALLPRRAPGRDRRARDDADEHRGADDARRRPGLAPGRGRGRDPRGRAGRARDGRALRADARRRAGRGARGRRSAGGRRRDRARDRTPPETGSRDSAIRCTSRSTRAPSGSSSSPTSKQVSGPHVALARALRESVAEVWGKPLTMNVSLPIAAVMLDLGFPAVGREVGADPRAHGRAARAPRRGARAPARLPDGRGGRGRGRVRGRLMLEPEVETRSWDEQLALDGASYRDQLAYLFERSAFYREKLDGGRVRLGRGRRRPRPTSQRCPFTEKRELRETVTPENPIGAHLCAAPAEIVRIYSTSGTTGAPSFIPLTAARSRQLGHRLGAQLRGLRDRRPASASSRPTTPARSSRARRSSRSTGSASATSRSAPATPSGWSPRSSC